MVGPHAEQQKVRDCKGKYVAFYFRHVEFVVPPGRRKHLTIIKEVGNIKYALFKRESNCSTGMLNNLAQVRAR